MPENFISPELAKFISPELAYDYAISQGYLSRDASSDHWVGHFTYMQSEGGFDWFKHRDTHERVKVRHDLD